jgi:hypothetical protein
MIDQTIPIPQLLQGMARCVREWIVPHVDDPMARTQAELLATLLDELPAALAAPAAAAIVRDTDAASEMLSQLVSGTPPASSLGAHATVDDLVAENSACKRKLEELARQLRQAGEGGAAAEQLRLLQQFFQQSLARELGGGVGAGTDFESMTAKDRAGRQG